MPAARGWLVLPRNCLGKGKCTVKPPSSRGKATGKILCGRRRPCASLPRLVKAELWFSEVAERVGFEPTVSCPTPHFECGALDHYATSPREIMNGSLPPLPELLLLAHQHDDYLWVWGGGKQGFSVLAYVQPAASVAYRFDLLAEAPFFNLLIHIVLLGHAVDLFAR